MLLSRVNAFSLSMTTTRFTEKLTPILSWINGKDSPDTQELDCYA